MNSHLCGALYITTTLLQQQRRVKSRAWIWRAHGQEVTDLSFFCSLAPKIWLWPLWSIKNSVQPLCNLYTLLVLWVWASKLHHFISFPVCYRSFMWVRQEVDAGGQKVKLMKLRTHFCGRLNKQWGATERVHWVDNVMATSYLIWPHFMGTLVRSLHKLT